MVSTTFTTLCAALSTLCATLCAALTTLCAALAALFASLITVSSIVCTTLSIADISIPTLSNTFSTAEYAEYTGFEYGETNRRTLRHACEDGNKSIIYPISLYEWSKCDEFIGSWENK